MIPVTGNSADSLGRFASVLVCDDVQAAVCEALRIAGETAPGYRLALRERQGQDFPFCENPTGLPDFLNVDAVAAVYRAAVDAGEPLQPGPDRFPAAFEAVRRAGFETFIIIPLPVADGRVVGLLEGLAASLPEPGTETTLKAVVPVFTSLLLQRRRENARRAAEAKFRTVTELIPAITYILALDARMMPMYVSPKIETLLGFRPRDFLNRPDFWQSRIHPLDREAAVSRRQDCCRRRASFSMEYRVLDRDGAVRWFHDQAQLVVDEQDTPICFQGMAFDITERKRAEETQASLEIEQRQAQKLEAIGTLAHGIAHEINNPIYGIMNYAQLIADDLGPDHRLGEYAREIIAETERVARIVQDLLVFARQEKRSHSPARICDIVQSVLSLMQTVIKEDQIHLEIDVPEDLPKIECRTQQIQQVLMNLLTNARDALNAKFPGYHADKILRFTARRMGERIRISVEDHGCGIPLTIRSRLFDPFFSTKPRNEGSGIGLSISHSIIRDHDGELSVESEVGEWTRFHVDLPILRDGSKQPPPPDETSATS